MTTKMFNEIKNNFATDDVIVKRNDLYKVSVTYERVCALIDFLGDSYNYRTLNAITCTDWIEDGHFAITYMISILDRTSTFMIGTMVTREDTKVKSLSHKFAQAEIMERDLAEMYGINFVGNTNLKELSLENWVHTPPLRREFDTLEFVNEHLTFREGRDDNVDTKAEAKRLRAIKKAEKDAAKKAKEEEKEELESKKAQEENQDGK